MPEVSVLKIGDSKRPYPKEKRDGLTEYNRRMLEEEGAEDLPVLKPQLYIGESRPVGPPIEGNGRGRGDSDELALMKKSMEGDGQADLETIKTLGAEVTGGLFDRVRFLGARIEETRTFIEERRRMNEAFNADISGSIADIEASLTTIVDKDELRQARTSLNLLKMERRKENNQYWRDMVALRNQMRELSEQFDAESRISELFKGLGTN